jgi:hypothetical protein
VVVRENSSIQRWYDELMLWGDLQLGDVLFARSGPWMITSEAHGDEFGYLLLDTGETGTYESKAHHQVSVPVMRGDVILNPETRDGALW